MTTGTLAASHLDVDGVATAVIDTGTPDRADDQVVTWRDSSAPLLDLLPDARLHVLSGCGTGP